MIKWIKTWQLRKQMMTSFLLLSVILMALIYAIISVNYSTLTQSASDSINDLVTKLTRNNMRYLMQECGSSVENDASNLGSNLWTLKLLLNEVILWKSLEAHQQIESYTYDHATSQNFSFTLDSAYGVDAISYDVSSYWVPDYSERLSDSSEALAFLAATAQLDRFITPLFRYQDQSQYFKRLNFIYSSQDNATQFIRMYPAEQMWNPNYVLNDSNTPFADTEYHYNYSYMLYKQNNNSDINYAISSGPYMDLKTFGVPLCSLSGPLVFNGSFIGVIQYEMQRRFFDEYTSNFIFLSSGYGIFFNFFGVLLGKPSNWYEFTDNSTLYLAELPNRTAVTWDYMESLKTVKSNNDSLRTITILDFYYQMADHYESTVLLPYNLSASKFGNWEYGFKVYVKVSEIDEIATKMKTIMDGHEVMMRFMGMVSCAFTIGAVMIFTYKVTVSVAKPLKTLITFADIINNKATERDFLDEARKEVLSLPEGEYQLKHLIKAFKDLMGSVVSQKKPREMLIKPIFYPLNQYNPNYVAKARKGVSDVNWREVVEQISEEWDEDQEAFDFLE